MLEARSLLPLSAVDPVSNEDVLVAKVARPWESLLNGESGVPISGEIGYEKGCSTRGAPRNATLTYSLHSQRSRSR
jgi:hypothetical protein